MDCVLREKLNNLFELLDSLENIKELEKIKKDNNSALMNLIDQYRKSPTTENKKVLYKNNEYLKYIKNELELNYLIMEINKKFKEGRGNCESN